MAAVKSAISVSRIPRAQREPAKRPPRAEAGLRLHIARVYAAPVLLVSLLASAGCAPLRSLHDQVVYHHGINEVLVGSTNWLRAKGAWRSRQSHYSDVPHLHDFADGFQSGYRNVASGDDGCAPPLPPRKYWTSRFEDLEGQERVAAWFAGYPHGARAAVEDGFGAWRSVQVSPTIRQREPWGFGAGRIEMPESAQDQTEEAPRDSSIFDPPSGALEQVPLGPPMPGPSTEPTGAMRPRHRMAERPSGYDRAPRRLPNVP